MPDRARPLALGLVLLVVVGLVLLTLTTVDGPAGDAGRAAEPADDPTPVGSAVAESEDETAAVVVPRSVPVDSTSHRLRLVVERWPDAVPIPGAVVRIEGPNGVLVARAHTSDEGRLERALPPRVGRVLVIASAPGHSTTEQHVEVTGDLTAIGLVPTSGWLGRVVTSLGAPVAGARVSADRYWPPRPAFLEIEDGELRLTGTEGTASAIVTDRTNDDGYYYVRPFDDSNVVDLVIAVVGTEMASEPLRVPLPLPDPWLPDLVVHPTQPLEGRVVDGAGRPFPEAAVLIDWSVGARRGADLEVAADADGWFRAPRHLGAAHVQVLTSGHYFLEARSGSLDLAADRDWIVVDPDVPRLTATLHGGGHVRGYLKDSSTTEVVFDARVDLWATGDDGTRLDLDSVLSDELGGFHLIVPPEHSWRVLTIDVTAAGFQADDFGVVAHARFAPVDTFFLAPVPGASVVRIQASGSARDNPLDVSAFVAPPGTPPRLKYLFSYNLASVTDDYQLVWEGEVRSGDVFSFRTDVDPASQLLVVADQVNAEGVLETGFWGPAPLQSATSDRLRVRAHPVRDVEISLENLPKGRPLLLQQTSWSPLSGRTWTDQRQLFATGDDEQVLDVGLSPLGLSFLELRLDRGPVSAPLASSGDWVRATPGYDVVLRVGEFQQVDGNIAWYSAHDWPDLCVALVGSAVPSWRREYLGESDWCVRPSPQGRFRFDAVPQGVYTLMLYRPAGTTGVEVLAQRTVTVDRDLHNLGVWSVRPGDEELVEIDL